MEDSQQQVFLGLGSNMGNRFAHLQKAVDAIFERVGSVHRISSVYQTPAMGFEGGDFLNCALAITTSLSPEKLIKALGAIEGEMGREKPSGKGYRSRPIDIDILFYGERVVDQKTLRIPHPGIPHRRFVLQPLLDLDPDLHHPVLKASVSSLLENSSDNAPMERISKWLRNPQQEFELSRFNYIAIEGNIGAGKTSLARMLAADFRGKLILERFMENPFLPKFYQDPSRFSFPLEMSFLADRYQQLLDDITQHDLFNDCVIADYDIYKSLIFARITLGEEEFALYKKLFNLMYRELPRPDIYVYLHQEPERLLKNIRKRGRPFERSIEKSYLQKIHEGYHNFIRSQHTENIRLIDISDMDFIGKRSDYLQIVRRITSGQSFGGPVEFKEQIP